ncbi:hypothetical protein BDV38DRAFT_291355 [Aspergillus pseudotamarii]|uniref:C2H2 finger domain protein n=1 Tax=Aspergillus pseudotamarii TaxID=132259 RepID=A0A5N6SAQ7_ASPPS|nr:uncharacterized protein BDV38DRAFT_291355 [Aspergillus pseudotamarii]KAE8130760.1 hypothetical protein BDV38DRAFT_291355 [Aspergillus pseudotamarii]
MARLPHTYTGRSSDDDETASSASFRLDSDDAAGVDLQTDVTDVTDSDVPPPTRRRDKGRSRQNRSMQRPSGGKSNKSEKGSPSLSRLATDSDCSSSGDDLNVDVRHSRSPEQRCPQKKIRKPTALSGAPTRNNDSNTSSSDDDCSGSGFDSDSDTDPDIDSDGELSSDSDDDGYADGTRKNITRMDERWERYCRKRNEKYRALPDSLWANPASALREARKKELTLFLRWCLRLRRGKNGRKLKGIKKFKSLDTDWKSFLRHYEKVTGEPMDDALGRRMRKSIRRIAREYELDTDEKEKTPMFIEDVVPLQETTLRTMEKRFDLGLQRMQQCLYPLMACFTVNRINAMRRLQYQHLQCSIQRDPHGGPPRILLEIKYKFAKKYMGVTQANTFPLPEIIYDPSLMLSPHTFLLGILFHDDAFRVPGIKSMEDLRRLWVEDGRQQMEVPLKRDKAKHYVFCKVKSVRGKIQIHRDQPISQSTLSRQLKTFGEIAGFKWSLFTHRFRYGGGTILNESGLVSDAKQNLIMKHADIRTFLNHYLPRRINTDMQALMRGLKPDSAMMRAVTRMGRWIDRRRPRELTDAQKATVEHDPELQKAIRKRDAFSKKLQRSQKKTGRKLDKLDKLKRGVTNTRNRLLYALRQRVREEFDEEQAVLDIERQLAGTAILDEEAKEQLQIEEQLLPQQIHLLGKLMTWPTSLSVEAEWQRRNEATEAVRLYCDVLEGGPRRGRRLKQTVPVKEPRKPSLPRKEVIAPTESPLLTPSHSRHEIALQEAGEDIRTAAKPRACFQCYGNPAGFNNRRLKQYSRHKGLLRHFRAVHLDDRHCNYCNESVDNDMCWRRHTVDKHRLNVRYLEDYPHDL